MKYSDLILNAFVTLIVTIIGGLSIWWMTGRPSAEKIEYTSELVGQFTTNAGAVSLVSFKVKNVGGAEANNVKVKLETLGREIVEKQVTLSTDPLATAQLSEIDGNLFIDLSSLVPSEELRVNLIIRGDSSVPEVSVRSSRTVATRSSGDDVGFAGFQKRQLILLIALLVIGQAVLMTWLSRSNFRSEAGARIPANVNNTAFLMIQQKLIIEARELLERKLKNSGGNAYEILNYALVLGLQGEREQSIKYFEIGSWYARSGHIKAVRAFNLCTLCIADGDLSTAVKWLTEALEGSKTSIVKYCEYSLFLKEAASTNTEIRNLLQSYQVSF